MSIYINHRCGAYIKNNILTIYVQLCTLKYMEITVSEFRKNLKGYFDSALNSEVVCIERGGVHYNLVARLPMDILKQGKGGRYNGDSPIVESELESPRKKVTINIPDTRAANGVCKIHGTPLDSRGKCLQKGCKYS